MSRRRNPFGSRLLGAADQSALALRIRVQVLLTGLLVMTNLVGAALVIVISHFVVRPPHPTRGPWWRWRSRSRSTSPSP